MYHVVRHAVKHANTCYFIFKTCEAHFVSHTFTRVGTQLCAVVFTFSSVTKGTKHGPNGTDVVLCTIEGSYPALYPYIGAHQEFKAAMSGASTSILRVAGLRRLLGQSMFVVSPSNILRGEHPMLRFLSTLWVSDFVP